VTPRTRCTRWTAPCSMASPCVVGSQRVRRGHGIELGKKVEGVGEDLKGETTDTTGTTIDGVTEEITIGVANGLAIATARDPRFKDSNRRNCESYFKQV
jgi:hypothetical protein